MSGRTTVVPLASALLWGAIAAAAPGAGCSPAGGQDPPASRSGRLFDAATVQRLCDEAAAANAAAAGLELKAPVPAVLLTAAEAHERRKAFAAGLTDEAGMTSAIDLMADFMFSDSMLGRYLPDEKVLYVIEDVLARVSDDDDAQSTEDLLFGVLAHELTHAYDDQVYGLIPQPRELKELMADPARLTELQARMSLLEGRATWVAELACQHVGRPTLPTISLEEARSAELFGRQADEGSAEAMGRGFVNALGRAKLVQYAYGREFARRAWAFGGEKFFAEVVKHMPLSLAELEDFERFKQRWAREMEEQMEADADASAPPAGDGG